MKKVCFLLQTPLTERDYRRFGVERIRSRGFEVVFWDMTRLLNPDYLVNFKIKTHGYNGVVEISTQDALAATCRNAALNTALVVDVTGARREILPAYKLLNNLGVPVALFRANAIPVNTRHDSRLISAAKGMLRPLKNRLKRLLHTGSSPRFILAGGLQSIGELPFAAGKAKVIRAHALDYDIYLDHKLQAPHSKAEGYIVFLDEYFPLHPDHFVKGEIKNPYTDFREYYLEINEMFRTIEEKFALDVVIAAHPRAQYESLPDLFSGRRVVRGETIGLVAYADSVLAHSSISLNFAVLFYKPVVFLLPEKVLGGHYEYHIRRVAGELGRTPYRLAELRTLDPEKERVLDRACYERYREDYIKTKGSPKKHFWDIVLDEVSAADGGRPRNMGPARR